MLKFSPRASRASLIHNFLPVSPFSRCRSLRVSDKPAEKVYNYEQNSLPFTMKHFFANFVFSKAADKENSKRWHRFPSELSVPP